MEGGGCRRRLTTGIAEVASWAVTGGALVVSITPYPVTAEELLNAAQPYLDDMHEMLDRDMLV